jgi:hypothetical protein
VNETMLARMDGAGVIDPSEVLRSCQLTNLPNHSQLDVLMLVPEVITHPRSHKLLLPTSFFSHTVPFNANRNDILRRASIIISCLLPVLRLEDFE